MTCIRTNLVLLVEMLLEILWVQETLIPSKFPRNFPSKITEYIRGEKRTKDGISRSSSVMTFRKPSTKISPRPKSETEVTLPIIGDETNTQYFCDDLSRFRTTIPRIVKDSKGGWYYQLCSTFYDKKLVKNHRVQKI